MSILDYLMIVGVSVTWVMSTAILAVAGVTLYLFTDFSSQMRGRWEKHRQEKGE